MLSVFVCEDEENYRNLIQTEILNFINKTSFKMEMKLCTDDPAKIHEILEQNNSINGLYFLDVEMGGGYNGVEVAKTIRQHDPRAFVVFVTAHKKYLSLTFELKVEALDYIYKENEAIVKNRIACCLQYAYENYINRLNVGQYIFKAHNGRKISVDFNDILFFKKDSPGTNRVLLYTKKRNFSFYSTLENVINELPLGHFYKCHQSYIINTNNLTEKFRESLYKGERQIIMPNGVICHVSTRKATALLKILESFV
jgi:two-component system response regulator AgrA